MNNLNPKKLIRISTEFTIKTVILQNFKLYE